MYVLSLQLSRPDLPFYVIKHVDKTELRFVSVQGYSVKSHLSFSLVSALAPRSLIDYFTLF